MYRKETALKRNFQKLRESPGVRYESVGRGFESLEVHHKEHQAEMLGAFSFVFSESKKTSA